MTNNPYLYEKLVEARHSQIRHDMQHSRKPQNAGQRRPIALNVVNRFGTWMVELGFRLQGTEQRHEATLS